jgi:hypothetical protein
LAKGKNVLHIGCVDHIQLINAKRLSNEWLHDYLISIANKCVGIDINQSSIDYLRNELRINDVYMVDIAGEPNQIISEGHWDYAILGEILEHVDDPCNFLKKIRSNYPTSIRRLIVTVPNALSYSNVKNSRRDRELINSDHRYWFTPYTLAKVAVRAGYLPKEFFLCNYGDSNQQMTGFKSSRAYRAVREIYRTASGRRRIRCDTVVMVLE